MTFPKIAAVAALLSFAAACTQTETAAVTGGIFGAAAGLALSELVDANPQWTAVAVAGGAVAGSLVAQNQVTQECAYSDGRGGYFIAAC